MRESIDLGAEDSAYRRGQRLFELHRYAEAQQQFVEHLKSNPEDPLAVSYIALCWMHQGKKRRAIQVAGEAIKLDPECIFAHVVLGQTLRAAGKSGEALETLRKALSLDPTRADLLGHIAHVMCDLKRWKESLEYSTQGLQNDPGDRACLHAHSWALIHTGKLEEAEGILRDVLQEHAEDDQALTFLGYIQLKRGQREKALDYFSSALQLDPESELARDGFMDALRMKYPLYGLVVRYLLWISSLPERVRWTLVVLEHFVERILRDIAQRQPALRPLIRGILYLWSIFAYLSWTGRPLCNSLLRLNKHARKFLKADEMMESNLVSGSVFLGLVAWVYWHTQTKVWSLVACIVYFTLSVPFTNAYSCQAGWPRNIMLAFAATLFVLGNLAIWGFHEYPLTGGYGMDCIRLYSLLLMVNQIVAHQLDKVQVDK